jgi:hypothetical protein
MEEENGKREVFLVLPPFLNCFNCSEKNTCFEEKPSNLFQSFLEISYVYVEEPFRGANVNFFRKFCKIDAPLKKVDCPSYEILVAFHMFLSDISSNSKPYSKRVIPYGEIVKNNRGLESCDTAHPQTPTASAPNLIVNNVTNCNNFLLFPFTFKSSLSQSRRSRFRIQIFTRSRSRIKIMWLCNTRLPAVCCLQL